MSISEPTIQPTNGSDSATAMTNGAASGAATPGIYDRRESEVRSYCRSWPTEFVSATGSTQTDTAGRTYIDFFAGAGALSYGHNHPVIAGSGGTQTLHGIGFGGANVDTAGADNDGNRVENCDIRKTQVGIASRGASLANKNSGSVLTRNLLNSTGANSLGRGGILAAFEDGILITENALGGIVSAGASDVFGISLGGLTTWTNATTSGGSEVTNATVTRNSLGTIQQTNGLSAAGILVAPATAGITLVANNFVSGVLANGTAGEFGAGIFVIDSGIDSATRIYANSISMTGTLAGGDQGQYALAVNGNNPLLDLRDNILFDTQATGAANLSYAIGLGYATFTNLTSNWNDLFVPAAGNFRDRRQSGLHPAVLLHRRLLSRTAAPGLNRLHATSARLARRPLRYRHPTWVERRVHLPRLQPLERGHDRSHPNDMRTPGHVHDRVPRRRNVSPSDRRVPEPRVRAAAEPRPSLYVYVYDYVYDYDDRSDTRDQANNSSEAL